MKMLYLLTCLLAAVTSVIAITTSQAQMMRVYPEAPPVPTRSYSAPKHPRRQCIMRITASRCKIIHAGER